MWFLGWLLKRREKHRLVDTLHLFISSGVPKKAVVDLAERLLENSSLCAACFTSLQSTKHTCFIKKLTRNQEPKTLEKPWNSSALVCSKSLKTVQNSKTEKIMSRTANMVSDLEILFAACSWKCTFRQLAFSGSARLSTYSVNT